MSANPAKTPTRSSLKSQNKAQNKSQNNSQESAQSSGKRVTFLSPPMLRKIASSTTPILANRALTPMRLEGEEDLFSGEENTTEDLSAQQAPIAVDELVQELAACKKSDAEKYNAVFEKILKKAEGATYATTTGFGVSVEFEKDINDIFEEVVVLCQRNHAVNLERYEVEILASDRQNFESIEAAERLKARYNELIGGEM